MWISRFDKESNEHSVTTGELLATKNLYKDEVLTNKTNEIKLQTMAKQVQNLQEQSVSQQHAINEQLTQIESLDRELNTQKEIMKQMKI